MAPVNVDGAVKAQAGLLCFFPGARFFGIFETLLCSCLDAKVQLHEDLQKQIIEEYRALNVTWRIGLVGLGVGVGLFGAGAGLLGYFHFRTVSLMLLKVHSSPTAVLLSCYVCRVEH